MVDNEIQTGHMDWALMKRLTAGDPFQGRGLYQDYEDPLEPTATIFVSLNSTASLSLGLQDGALYDRLRFLSYPTPAKLDPTLKERVKFTPAVRQAVLARLVQYHVKTHGPPEDVPNVETARQKARSEAIGDAGRWLTENLVATHNPDDRLSKKVLWRMAEADSGGQSGKVWGKTSTQLTKLLRDLFELPPAAATWIPDERETHSGWKGIRLATQEERAKNAVGQLDMFSTGRQTNTAESTEEEVCGAPLPEAGATCEQDIEDGRCRVADTHACPRCRRQRADCRCHYEGVGGPDEARALNAKVKHGQIDNIEAYRQHTKLTAPGQDVDQTLQVVDRWRQLRDTGAASEIAVTIASMDVLLTVWQGEHDDPIMALIAGVRNDLESARVRALRREGFTAHLPGLGEVR